MLVNPMSTTDREGLRDVAIIAEHVTKRIVPGDPEMEGWDDDEIEVRTTVYADVKHTDDFFVGQASRGRGAQPPKVDYADGLDELDEKLKDYVDDPIRKRMMDTVTEARERRINPNPPAPTLTQKVKAEFAKKLASTRPSPKTAKSTQHESQPEVD